LGDSFRDVSHESWASRLTGSIKSVLAGFVLAASALPLMWCNEGRAVTTARSLEEGSGAVIEVGTDAVDPANQGRIVHLTGRAETGEVLRDPHFGVSARALKLVRTTEMYQWDEYEKEVERDKAGGGKERVREYSYSKRWSEKPIDSDNFRHEGGHENPKGPIPFASTTFVAGSVALGAFSLSRELLDKITDSEPLPVAEAVALPPAMQMQQRKDGFYRGQDPDNPRVGDLRVRFGVVRPQVVSIVAGQSGRSFAPYQTRAGDALLMLAPGSRTAAAMFRAEAIANSILTWCLRAAGFLFVFLGVALVFRPIAVLGSVVPLVGSLLEAGLWVFSFGFAAALSSATIATAWVFYRPLFAATLVGASGGLLFWLKRRGARRTAAPS
jgi:hypothetical protein